MTNHVAKFCYCRRKVLSQPWQCSATEAEELCGNSERTVREQRENCATGVGELCHWSGRTMRRLSENFATGGVKLE
ncbi:MAG: hypothetical protein IJ901_02395 [Bacteroidaceae bacterium]|nr:hypothetical protein [Bacteroidaceae bacterium]